MPQTLSLTFEPVSALTAVTEPSIDTISAMGGLRCAWRCRRTPLTLPRRVMRPWPSPPAPPMARRSSCSALGEKRVRAEGWGGRSVEFHYGRYRQTLCQWRSRLGDKLTRQATANVGVLLYATKPHDHGHTPPSPPPVLFPPLPEPILLGGNEDIHPCSGRLMKTRRQEGSRRQNLEVM